jgi:type I restriction enzyme S subunit
MTPSKDRPDFWDGTVPWVSPKDMKQPLLEDSIDHVTELAVASTGLKLHAVDSVMVVTRGMILAHTFPVARNIVPVTVNQDMKALRVRPGVDARYLAWMLKGLESLMLSLTDESAHGTKALRTDQWENLRVPMPSPAGQERIAIFLDEQTARIDALIAEKDRLIERLHELGIALCAYEMAGGSSAMTPTHYECFPTVPKTWRVLPFKHAVRFLEGPGIMAADFRDEGIPLLRVSSVRGEVATLDGCNYLDPSKVAKTWNHFRVKKGDLLISASASMGRVSLVTEETEGAVPYTGIIILRPIEGVITRDFVRHFVVSDQFMRQIDNMKSGATIQHFGPSHLNRVMIATPFSLVEQEAVAKRLTERRSQHLYLTEHAVEHIGRLREYRSSLITAAVTGQLDINSYKKAA